MKKYEIYKNIRKRALIFGLPISFFALFMMSTIISLLVIIFSFGLSVIATLLLVNCCLYILLMRIAQGAQLFHYTNPFPKIISNKKTTTLLYEED
nr:hypothetical protein [Maribacter dokdonensis]